MSAPQPGRILRLVKSGPERRALESGEVDAVLDPATGTAMLLPDAPELRPVAWSTPPSYASA